MKRCLQIFGVMLIALFFLIGCEDGSTGNAPPASTSENNGTNSEGDAQLLLTEIMLARNSNYFPEPSSESANTYTFSYSLTADDITSMEEDYGDLQFIDVDTELSGSVSITGATFAEYVGDTLTDNPYITLTYNIKVEGSTIPGGTALLVVTAAGTYEGGPDSVSAELNGEPVEFDPFE